MKKTFLLLSAAISAGMLFGQSQRLVLIEEFTQASCGPCASQNPAFNTLLAANTTKAVSIKYQTDWPGTDPMNAQNKADVQTRVTYYACNGVPYGLADATAFTGSSYAGAPANCNQTKINTAYAVTSPFNLVLTHYFNAANDSIFISCQVTCTQAVTMTTPKVRVAMIEKTITFTTAPGSNGEKVFEHVMRAMYPSAAGTTVATAWTVGQTQTLTFAAKIPTYIYKKTEIATVAWLQDDGNKNVKQAAYSPAPTVTGVSDITADNLMNVFPNPSNGLFTADFQTDVNDNYTVKITSVLGQVVYEEALNNFSGTYSKQMDIATYGKGIYMLSISNSKNQTVKKVLVQ